MKVLLLANQPERTTRLRMFMGTLQSQGHEVIVPSFGTRNWISIARQAKRIALEQEPDVVHIFNVPDVIYHGFSALRGKGARAQKGRFSTVRSSKATSRALRPTL